MKRVNIELIVMGLLYLLLVGFEVPFVYRNGFSLISQADFSSSENGGFLNKPFMLESEENLEEKEAPIRHVDIPYHSRPERIIKDLAKTPLSSLNFSAGILNSCLKDGILKSAKEAFELGGKLWQELESMAKIVVMKNISKVLVLIVAVAVNLRNARIQYGYQATIS